MLVQSAPLFRVARSHSNSGEEAGRLVVAFEKEDSPSSEEGLRLIGRADVLDNLEGTQPESVRQPEKITVGHR